MINISIIIIAFVICLSNFLYCHWYTNKTFFEIETVLDSVLNINKKMEYSTIKDTRISKLAHKAHKIAEMSTINVVKTNQEKETIQSFISDMSHQIKTPLASISMYIEIFLNNSLNLEEQREFSLRIKYGIQKLEWLTNILFKLSRLETGIITLNPTNNEIKNTITECITSVYTMASKKNIEIKVSEFDDFKLYYDNKWTIEALINILENAIKYSEKFSTIDISIEQLSIYSKISVTNYGIGIRKEDFNNIFKRFYRGENSTDTEGTGLGLYLARLIFEKQGGYIMVDSEHREYVKFSMFLQNCKD